MKELTVQTLSVRKTGIVVAAEEIIPKSEKAETAVNKVQEDAQLKVGQDPKTVVDAAAAHAVELQDVEVIRTLL